MRKRKWVCVCRIAFLLLLAAAAAGAAYALYRSLLLRQIAGLFLAAGIVTAVSELIERGAE